MLLRVLPSVYPRQPEPIHRRLHGLAALIPQLQEPEQQHLIRLLQAVAQEHPLVSTCVAAACPRDSFRRPRYRADSRT